MYESSGQPESNPKKKADHASNKDLEKRISLQNHFCPSMVTLWRELPQATFHGVNEQPWNIEAHLALLQSNADSVHFVDEHFSQYPCQLICDEQPVSQTTFIREEEGVQYLMGLNEILSYGQIVEMGGIEEVMKQLDCGTLSYIESVLEFRLVDVSGTHCSNPLTVHIAKASKTNNFVDHVTKAVDIVKSCMNCRSNELTCSYHDGKKYCRNCQQYNIQCVNISVLGLVCDMASHHKAAEQNVEKIVKQVYGMYHICKALVNHLKNKTLVLKGTYYSIQVLMSLYSKSLQDNGYDIGSLPRTVLVTTDRQSDSDSYLICSKKIRNTLTSAQVTTFQRYPDVYMGPKSSHQAPLTEISTEFTNKNGEIFFVEGGLLWAISHHVFWPKEMSYTIG